MEDMDVEKIINIVNTIKEIQNINEQNTNEQDTNDHKNKKSSIDIIKSEIPNIDEKYQINFNLIMKLIEIDKLIDKFRRISLCDNRSERQVKILQAVKPELNDRRQKIVDVVIKVLEIKSIMEVLGNE